jgi:hypothetical protein
LPARQTKAFNSGLFPEDGTRIAKRRHDVESALTVPLKVPLPLMPLNFPVPPLKVRVPSPLTGFPSFNLPEP